jgi:hypothetical protein
LRRRLAGSRVSGRAKARPVINPRSSSQ